MRRRVRVLSLTFGDFDFGGFSVCGLTCAAHTPGTKNSPATMTKRRRERVPNIDILFVPNLICSQLGQIPYLLRCKKPASGQLWPQTSAHLRDITGLTAFEAITKFFLKQTLISI